VFYASNLYSGFMGVQPVCPAPFVLFHTWSLAIEEQFYAVWPAIVRLLNPRRLVVLCLALAVCANVSRFGFADQLNPRAAWCLTWCRLDGLALGSVAAVITRSEIERERLRFLAVVGFAVSAVGLTGLFLARHGLRDTDIWTLRVGLMMTPLFSTALVLSAAAGGFAANLFSVNILRFFGRYSYGMYLWQILPSDGLARKYFLIVPRTGFLEISFIPAYIALLTFVAIVSYHLYERPFLLLKERFRSGASRSLATSSLGSDDPADQDARPLSGGLVP
jgi:peptidoglycan/LPS O-acetylase OafA/YrhL